MKSNELYDPREDSYLILKEIKSRNLQDLETLDMGIGKGILTLEMARKGAKVTAVDINENAIKYVDTKSQENNLHNQITFKTSDLFDNVEQKFDLITFNPPYLPNSEANDPIWSGGKKGTEIIERFLEEAENYLKSNGKALIIVSDRTKFQELEKKYGLERIGSEKIWFEKLYLLEYT